MRTDLRLTTLTLDPSRENLKMKITNLLMSLSLAGACFSQASGQIPHSAPPAAKRSIGDSSPSANLPPAFLNKSSRSLSDQDVSFATEVGQPPQTPIKASTVSYASGSSGCSTGSCGDSDFGPLLGSCSPSNNWFDMESLLWFSSGIASPPLVNTSDFGVLPIAGTNTVLGGGDGIEMGLLPGFRVSGGTYLGCDQKLAIGGRGYGLFNGSTTYTLNSDGSGAPGNPSIGIPFYDLSINAENAFLVAYQDNLGPDKAGLVRARTDLDMYGADGSLYMLLTSSNDMRMDLLGGYTFNTLRNSLSLETVSNSFRFPNVGAITTTNDLFATENVFHGGHLGVLSSVRKSRVSFSTLAKVAFGNMRQTSTVRGYSIIEDALANQAVLGAGILTQPSNIGVRSRDTFGFIPELGIKLGFAASENVQFTVGYTLLVWSGVALAGNQVDNVVDPTQLVFPNAAQRPNALLNESAFWMQGVDLGMSFAF